MTNEATNSAVNVRADGQSEDDRVSLMDVAQVVADNLRLLVVVPMAAGFIALGLSFFISPTYTAVATFLPPQQQQSMASSLLQSLGAIGSLAGASSALKNPNDQYVSFLKSNAVEDELIERFKLMERYKAKFREDARKILEKNTRILSGKDNIISVEFDDEVPSFAAEMANAYGQELTKLLARLALTEAQQRRLFFGKQLATTKDSLISAEQALAAVGVSVSSLNSNPITALAGPAALRAQVTAQEVKLASMRSYLTDAAPEFRQAQAELLALRRELSKAEEAQPASKNGGNDYIAKYREFKYQETLFDLFSRQYELARIDESREGALVQVIDVAQIPQRKVKPKKATIALITTFGVAALLLMFVFLRNAWQKAMLNDASVARVRRLKFALRRSFGRG